MTDFEKLGAFFLGHRVDPATGAPLPEPILYDSKDLTTHAVCVGMTGSGKTGLGLALLEEAVIDGIPVIAIDPKGDLGNLLLAFPRLRGSDFAPWVDPSEALRRGRTTEQHAAELAAQWAAGLAESGQDGARIERFRAASEPVIWTPGSDAGLPLAMLRSFAAPPAELATDLEAWSERIRSAVDGLLALLDGGAKPGFAAVLLGNLVDHAWRRGQDLDLAELIRGVQSPPFARIGVLDVDTAAPPAERTALAMALNAIVAAPGFAIWLAGAPLDAARLLFTATGRPRLSIVSIAHLPDAQRMAVVTLLLGEILAWLRRQSGTSSLRAILYFDEVFGFLPPVANPPSKLPLLTLLKQARAFGLGCVLATQNPVDLDYKALANAGTWFLGRMQTERDKARVLDGLEGATAAQGLAFDRAAADRLLSALPKRGFLMQNVHDDAPLVLRSRQLLSYLRGPLTRTEIATLMAPQKAIASPRATGLGAATVAATSAPAPAGAVTSGRPALPPGIVERFVIARGALEPDERLEFRPALLGTARVHFASSKDDVDLWRDLALVAPLGASVDADPFDDPGVGLARSMPPCSDQVGDQIQAGAGFAAVPSELSNARAWVAWRQRLAQALHRSARVVVHRCRAARLVSAPDEDLPLFRARCVQGAREARDRELEVLRRKHAPRLASLAEKLRRAEERVARESSQVQHETTQTAIAIGATLLGAFFGRRTSGASAISRAAGAMRSASRVGRERQDVARASESVEAVRAQLVDAETEFQAAVAALRAGHEPDALAIESSAVAPRKGEITVLALELLWVPWALGPRGARALVEAFASPGP
ncbi:MAG: ATP-binding protein [Planctomycetes bacterium]|nr:ATP-binding protein [Planctomycetota bacterium]